MALSDVAKLIGDGTFGARVQAQLVSSAVAIYNEATNEVQTLTVTGTPTGGSFTLTSLPGSVVLNQAGTLTNASAAVTGLATTVGLFVGMAVTGTNVPAGVTVASITSLTALTLSANATGTGTQALTFSGTPVVSVAFNATAADVQANLQAQPNIGVGNVLCGGGPLPGTPVTITFGGPFAATPQRVLTLGTNALTGGAGPTASVARTTVGTPGVVNHAARAALASRILADPSGYSTRMVNAVAADTTVQSDYTGGADSQAAVTDAHIAGAVSGVFNAYT